MLPSAPAAFSRGLAALGLNVSRETLENFAIYAALVEKWGKKINLVAESTLGTLWERHFLDSAQLLPLLLPEERKIADFGSGAGFPGLALALLDPDREFFLLEADSRKCAFLQQVAIETKILSRLHICNERIEEMKSFPIDVAVARACAPLGRLLEWMEPFIGDHGRALLLKGRQAEEELTEASQHWTMQIEKRQSITDPEASALLLSRLRKKKNKAR